MSFRCKGNVYLGLFESLRPHASKEEVCARIESTSLRAFAMQPFLMASWYDIEPILALGETGARITGKTYTDFMRAMAVDQANRDVGGVYRVLLKLANPSAVVDRLPRVANRYFDFVRSVLLTPPESPAILEVSGILATVAPTYRIVTEPYITRALTLAGARNVVHSVAAFEPDASVGGRSTVKFKRSIAWQ